MDLIKKTRFPSIQVCKFVKQQKHVIPWQCKYQTQPDRTQVETTIVPPNPRSTGSIKSSSLNTPGKRLGETRDWLRVKVSLSDLLTLCGLAVRAVLGVWFLLALCALWVVGATAALAVWGLTAKLPVLTVLRLAPRLLSRLAVDVVGVVAGRPGGAATVAGRGAGDVCRGAGDVCRRAGAAGLRLGLAARGADGARTSWLLEERRFRAVRLPPGSGGQWGTNKKMDRVWWLNLKTPTFEKYAQVKLDHFPSDPGENQKSLRFHHLDVQKGNKNLIYSW